MSTYADDFTPLFGQMAIVHTCVVVARDDRRACASTCPFIDGVFLQHRCALYKEPLVDVPRGNLPLVIERCTACRRETP